jgi:catechol 2,3-dioxygenase-like lactoylglutathione lyase family enzyme
VTTQFDRRTFLLTVPALFASRAFAQVPAAFKVNGLSQIVLTVSNIRQSLEFYQGLFGMPIQARQGSTVLLKVGVGPRFLALRQAADGERPSISALGFGVENFSVDGAMKTLSAHGFSAAPATASKPGPRQALVRVRGQDEGGSRDGGTRDLFAADPSGVVFQLHDVAYCGGSGPLGKTCGAAEAAPRPGLMAVKDLSHFTIAASDPDTVQCYLDLFGFKPLAYQATAPAWQVGSGVHFLMFIGGGGPTRAGAGGPPPGPPAGAPPAARGPARAAGIDHACLSMTGFDAAKVTDMLVGYGLKKVEGQARTPLVTYISLRMPNRGGAEGGTPELYFTDPDGLAIQLQDVTYCGGGGLLGELCPPLPAA